MKNIENNDFLKHARKKWIFFENMLAEADRPESTKSVKKYYFTSKCMIFVIITTSKSRMKRFWVSQIFSFWCWFVGQFSTKLRLEIFNFLMNWCLDLADGSSKWTKTAYCCMFFCVVLWNLLVVRPRDGRTISHRDSKV